MNGFDDLDTTPNTPDLTRSDIQGGISRGQRRRAKQLADWGRKVALTWASLFRRPGRLLPTHHAWRNRLPQAPSVYVEAERA